MTTVSLPRDFNLRHPKFIEGIGLIFIFISLVIAYYTVDFTREQNADYNNTLLREEHRRIIAELRTIKNGSATGDLFSRDIVGAIENAQRSSDTWIYKVLRTGSFLLGSLLVLVSKFVEWAMASATRFTKS